MLKETDFATMMEDIVIDESGKWTPDFTMEESIQNELGVHSNLCER